MSIYNGFSTRKQEQDYNILLEQTIFLLQTYIVKILKEEKVDENKFTSYFEKLFNTLEQFEDHKYLDPKYSVTLRPLAKALNIKQYQFLDTDINVSCSLKKQSISPSPYNNDRSSSRNSYNSNYKRQYDIGINENKQNLITSSGKWLYQTISEIGNQRLSQMSISSTKEQKEDNNLQKITTLENQSNGKYVVQLKALSNRKQIETPSSYKPFCVMSLSPPSSSNISCKNDITLRQDQKQNGQGTGSHSRTLYYIQNKIIHDQSIQENNNSIYENTQTTGKTIEGKRNFISENEEQNIRLDNMILQKQPNKDKQLYEDYLQDGIQSSRNYNQVYKESTSLSIGKRNLQSSLENSILLPKHNTIESKSQKKKKLQQQRMTIQEQELQLTQKNNNSIDQSFLNEQSFMSQIQDRHSVLSNPQIRKQNSIDQVYKENNPPYQKGVYQQKGGVLRRNAYSKNTSPVSMNNTINHDDINYLPKKNFQKAIPILKPLYQGKKETRESFIQRIQDQLQYKEQLLNRNHNRQLAKLSQSPQPQQQSYLERPLQNKKQN